jgi:hypothetical protein
MEDSRKSLKRVDAMDDEDDEDDEDTRRRRGRDKGSEPPLFAMNSNRNPRRVKKPRVFRFCLGSRRVFRAVITRSEKCGKQRSAAANNA